MPAMFARQTPDGVSVNESAICTNCLSSPRALRDSLNAWTQADDVRPQGGTRDTLLPVDNPDAHCCGCGNTTDVSATAAVQHRLSMYAAKIAAETVHYEPPMRPDLTDEAILTRLAPCGRPARPEDVPAIRAAFIREYGDALDWLDYTIGPLDE